MARPTQSGLLYAQMIGRGLRTFPGKTCCVVIDMADTSRLGLPSAATLMGLPKSWRSKGEDVREAAEALERIVEESPYAAADATSIEDALRRKQQIDLSTPDEVRQRLAGLSPFTWLELPNGALHLGLPDRLALRVRQNLLGSWEAYTVENTVTGPVSTFATQAAAVQAADAYVRGRFPHALGLVDRSASWRTDPASEKQIALLHRYRLYRPGLSKGQAGELLDAYFARLRRRPGAGAQR
jgi:ATP-dependent helicase IRC3